ncbi:hypothetical protein [Paenilisteria rocourtiae]|uniref:Uncharacterized protein n=1 Tax=Listeria rocourtiae TaxID=647910 RepID=A0A4R6ZIE0_9LIST|nr:hypothetical protein [Listeria rocourtiae]EUJ46634.1 hypothetical protein PROCOU_10963 [Listeria rocourtiae FSL F6-920]MBC1435982.1 hypothetical protein [Listeria rocourtiae]TDR51764.1 hypothetical protein DFP96_11170 [Listeria rocourtiae]
MENQLDEKAILRAQLTNPRWMTLTLAIICSLFAIFTLLGVFVLFSLSTEGIKADAIHALKIARILASLFCLLYAIFALLLFNNYSKLRKGILVPKMLYFALSVFVILSAANSIFSGQLGGVFLPLIILLFTIKIILDLGKIK